MSSIELAIELNCDFIASFRDRTFLVRFLLYLDMNILITMLVWKGEWNPL